MFAKILTTTAAMTLATAAFAQVAGPATPAAPTIAAPAAAPAAAGPAAGTATAADIGVQPLENVPSPNYVAWAWDSNNYEIDAAKIALRKATRPGVKTYAQAMQTSHETMMASLQASLKNPTREFIPPATRLSPANAALIKQLEDAPKAGFDSLYLTQQVTAHQKAWALNKGFANGGQDEALKTLATTNVPMIEQHLADAKTLSPASLASR